MNKVTEVQIRMAKNRLAKKLTERAIRLAAQNYKQSGQSLNGIINNFTQDEANGYVAKAFVDEMHGISMPPPIDYGIGNIIDVVFSKFNKAADSIARAIHKTMKKYGPYLLGGIVGVLAGPAGQVAAQALSKAAAKYTAKKMQDFQIQSMIDKAIQKASRDTRYYKLLPLGVSPEQARELANAKLPAGMSMDRAWHIFEESKLIDKGLKPSDAHVVHYHSYQMDAPAIKYTPPWNYELAEQLREIKKSLENGDNLAPQLINKIINDPIYKQFMGSKNIFIDLLPVAWRIDLLPANEKQAAVRQITLNEQRDRQFANSKGIPYEQYKANQEQIQAQQGRNKAIIGLTNLINKLRSYKATKPAVKFNRQEIQQPSNVPLIAPSPQPVTSAGPVLPVTSAGPILPVTSAGPVLPSQDTWPVIQSQENMITIPPNERGEAIKNLQSEETTQALIDQAKIELQNQGINVNTPETEEMLRLQIAQLQQQVTNQIQSGQPIQIDTIQPEPEIVVSDTGDGTAVTVKKESNILPLLLTAGAVLFALKGG